MSKPHTRAEALEVPGPTEDYEQWFVSNLPAIEQVTQGIARRHWLAPEEADDLRSAVFIRLIDHDYAVLRKFEGRSSLRTFLTVVVQRIFLDERVARWGKWRPSADARRGGPVAVLLERLTVRDRLSFEEAIDVLTSRHQVDLTRAAFEAIYATLPRAVRPRLVDDAALADCPSPAPTPALLVEAASSRQVAAHASRALAAELARLDDDDRRMLTLRFIDGLTIREIAERMSAGEANIKAFYRRLRRLLDTLRAHLEQRGLRREDVLAAIGAPGRMAS